MGIRNGGIYGVGYVCGCWDYSNGTKSFCGNSKHKIYSCGCYNIGGNLTICGKHFALYLIDLGLITILAAIITGLFGGFFR